jgi:hypothetical protein
MWVTLESFLPSIFNMNKYLLLRNNKQSGPYSVPELTEKGLKAYDLVWLEGKSAAWRYPSEIEELKAFAPVVEEQPFDRFYKKPEPVKEKELIREYTPNIQVASSEHSRYEPKPEEQPAMTSAPSKKVYINFPGTQKKAVEQKAEVIAEKQAEQAVFTERLVMEERRAVQLPVENAQEKKKNYFQYAAIAACLLMVSLITYLVINHNRQKQNIEALNALILKLDQKTKEQKSVVVPAAVVQEEPPAPPATINYSEEITEEKPVTPTVKPGNSSVEKPRSGISEKESVVFKEAKASPATSAGVPPVVQDSESDKSVPHENLFKLVSVKSNKYKTGVLGGISNLQLELTNNSVLELHKVAVEIRYLGPEKKVVKTQTVYFENVAPGAQTTLDIPKSNRGVSIDYTITDIKS